MVPKRTQKSKMKNEFSPCIKCGLLKDRSSRCKNCRKIYLNLNKDRVRNDKKKWYEANKSTMRLSDHEYYLANKEKRKEKVRIYQKVYRDTNQEVLALKKRLYYQGHKEEVKATIRAYCQANPDKIAARNRKRQASKLRRTPPWLSEQQLTQMGRYYTAAKWVESILGEPIEVDHIVPLCGKNVSGLHVPWNLQLLTKEDNCIKGNTFPGNDPNPGP
jgi:hypothetical protein